jgi:hypothetical protein
VPPTAAKIESQIQIYQAAVTLYRARRYQEAISQFRLAHELHPLPRILLNIANAFRHLAEGAEPVRVRFVAARAIANFNRYLSEEHEPPMCGAMRQRASAQHLFDGKVHGLDEPVQAVESAEALRAAYRSSGNPGLFLCIARAHLAYAKALKTPAERMAQARLALAAYRDYQTARIAHGQASDLLVGDELVEALVLLNAPPARPAGMLETPPTSLERPVVVD